MSRLRGNPALARSAAKTHDARELGDALADTAGYDRGLKARATALRQQDLTGLRRKKNPASDLRTDGHADKAGVFVNVVSATDQSKVAPGDAG